MPAPPGGCRVGEGITEERLPEWSLGNASARCYQLGAQLRILGVVDRGAASGVHE